MWEEMVPVLVEAIWHGTPSVRKEAMEDLLRMARALDRLVYEVENEAEKVDLSKYN